MPPPYPTDLRCVVDMLYIRRRRRRRRNSNRKFKRSCRHLHRIDADPGVRSHCIRLLLQLLPHHSDRDGGIVCRIDSVQIVSSIHSHGGNPRGSRRIESIPSTSGDDKMEPSPRDDIDRVTSGNRDRYRIDERRRCQQEQYDASNLRDDGSAFRWNDLIIAVATAPATTPQPPEFRRRRCNPSLLRRNSFAGQVAQSDQIPTTISDSEKAIDGGSYSDKTPSSSTRSRSSSRRRYRAGGADRAGGDQSIFHLQQQQESSVQSSRNGQQEESLLQSSRNGQEDRSTATFAALISGDDVSNRKKRWENVVHSIIPSHDAKDLLSEMASSSSAGGDGDEPHNEAVGINYSISSSTLPDSAVVSVPPSRKRGSNSHHHHHRKIRSSSMSSGGRLLLLLVLRVRGRSGAMASSPQHQHPRPIDWKAGNHDLPNMFQLQPLIYPNVRHQPHNDRRPPSLPRAVSDHHQLQQHICDDRSTPATTVTTSPTEVKASDICVARCCNCEGYQRSTAMITCSKTTCSCSGVMSKLHEVIECGPVWKRDNSSSCRDNYAPASTAWTASKPWRMNSKNRDVRRSSSSRSSRSFIQKYGPRWMGEIVGQEMVIDSLCRAVKEGNVAPLYLFHGARGTGKTSTATAFAVSINCSNTIASRIPKSSSAPSVVSAALSGSDPSSSATSRSVSGRFVPSCSTEDDACCPANPGCSLSKSLMPKPCGQCRNSPPNIIQIDAASVSAAAASISDRHTKRMDDHRRSHIASILNLLFSAPQEVHSRRYKVCIIEECHLLTQEAWQLLLAASAQGSMVSRTTTRTGGGHHHPFQLRSAMMNSKDGCCCCCDHDEPQDGMTTIMASCPAVEHQMKLVFILITSDAEQLPKSMASCCHNFAFANISVDNITRKLREICAIEGIDADQDALRFIASRSDGSLCEAEMALDQLSNLGRRITTQCVREMAGLVAEERLTELLDMALSAVDNSRTVRCVQELVASGVDPLALVSQLADLITDIMAGIHVLRGNAPSPEQQEKLRRALRILSEGEEQLRMDKRATWLIAALLRFATLDFFKGRRMPNISVPRIRTAMALPDRDGTSTTHQSKPSSSPIAINAVDHDATISRRVARRHYSRSKEETLLQQQQDEENKKTHLLEHSLMISPGSERLRRNRSRSSRPQTNQQLDHRSETITRETEPLHESPLLYGSRGLLIRKQEDQEHGEKKRMSPLVIDTTTTKVRRELAYDMTHSTMDDIWEKVLDGSPSSVLRQTLSREGRLVSLSVSEEADAVAHLEFRSVEDMQRATTRKNIIAKSFQLALGCPVRVELTLASSRNSPRKETTPPESDDKTMIDSRNMDKASKAQENQRCADKTSRSSKDGNLHDAADNNNNNNDSHHGTTDMEKKLGPNDCLRFFSRTDHNEPKTPATRPSGFLCWKMGTSRWKNSESMLKEVALSIRTKRTVV